MMDILLSVPIASYFFTTSLTSWSTSLNLLFFYMTWTTLVLSHSPIKIELLGVTALRVGLWLIPSLVFLLFDTLIPSLAESIKFGGASALPPRDALTILRLLGLAVVNLALETALEAGLSLGIGALFYGGAPLFRTSSTLPLPWQIIKHVALLFATREVLTYYVHRNVLHNGSGSTKSVASLHAKFAHSRSAPPFSLVLLGDHPIPFLLHRFLPVFVPAAILGERLHILSYFAFVAFVTLEETLVTSGYSIVPGIIMGGMARRCASHYSRPVGNYGPIGLLDFAHGTTLGKDVISDVKDEAEKHHVKERSLRKADDASLALQDGIDGLRRSVRKSRGKKRTGSGE
jgi:hypothetical protein